MVKRRSLSKKVRFEIFKRDGFTCVYCGNTPPSVVLEVDHIEPVSKGGDDSMENLITSCFDCNRGKRDVPLDQIPPSLSESIEVIKEREEQLKSYRRLLTNIKRRKTRDANDIEKIFMEAYPDKALTDKFKKVSMARFLNSLPKNSVEEAMILAISKIRYDPEDCVKYFCGVCWRKIKGDAKFST
jgi:CRISPR/Cas system Type II protein with McrA/HNH and RuvC-like nuclease domain